VDWLSFYEAAAAVFDDDDDNDDDVTPVSQNNLPREEIYPYQRSNQ